MPARSRTPWIAGIALLACALFTSAAHAQAPYPTQTIKFLVQAAAGGLPDTVARITARRLQEVLGQSIVVENRPGPNGGLAAAALTLAPAGGYTFLVTAGPVGSIQPLLYNQPPSQLHDLLPAALLARAPLCL